MLLTLQYTYLIWWSQEEDNKSVELSDLIQVQIKMKHSLAKLQTSHEFMSSVEIHRDILANPKIYEIEILTTVCYGNIVILLL